MSPVHTDAHTKSVYTGQPHCVHGATAAQCTAVHEVVSAACRVISVVEAAGRAVVCGVSVVNNTSRGR